MIYTASYFNPAHHHGQRISISRSVPKGVVVDRSLPFLAPPAALLTAYKQWEKTEAKDTAIGRHTDAYREHIRSVWGQLLNYLEQQAGDETWLCWEKQGQFCHRNLVIRVVERYYPERFGGCDIAAQENQP